MAKPSKSTFTVINTNINYCGDAHDESLARMVKIVKKVDIIALQEAHTICFQRGRHFGEELAAALDANVYSGINGTSLVSRHSIYKKQNNGAIIDVNGHKILYKVVHLTDVPFQPFQIAGVEYGKYPKIETAAAAERSSKKSREAELEWYLRGTKSETCTIDGHEYDVSGVIMSGDFNEPSHLDWSEKAAEAKRVPFAVNWHCSRRLEGLGYIDAYRYTHPSELRYPGFSWGIKGYDQWSKKAAEGIIKKERIDFIYTKRLDILGCSLIGPDEPDWISDHASVIAKFKMVN